MLSRFRDLAEGGFGVLLWVASHCLRYGLDFWLWFYYLLCLGMRAAIKTVNLIIEIKGLKLG